jgi:hypothetical protein
VARISSILQKIEGVKKHENKDNILVITFDDEETSLRIIIEELKKGRFIIKEEPVYLR